MEGVAVSAQKAGLLPISQQATLVMLSLSYHDYEGLALNPDEKGRLQADLGDTRSMILRNHGLLTVGRTVADAFMSMFTLQRACEVQLLAQRNGAELIDIPQIRARHGSGVLAHGDARRGQRAGVAGAAEKDGPVGYELPELSCQAEARPTYSPTYSRSGLCIATD